MAKEKSERELTAEVVELERMLAEWPRDGDIETTLGRQLVRQVIARRRTQLRHLRKAMALEDV